MLNRVDGEDGENQCNHEDTKLHEDHEKNNRFSSSCVFVFFVVLADVVALAVLSRRTEETSLCRSLIVELGEGVLRHDCPRSGYVGRAEAFGGSGRPQ